MILSRHDSVAAPRRTHHVSRFTFHERGVALVITLVLLSVITFMTVAFLVLTRSQHGSVGTETDQAGARFAADAARERAITELIIPILASTNEFNYGLLVSTNYVNSEGFDQSLPAAPPVVVNPTNVNYDVTRSGASVSSLPLNQQLQNLANLLYNPRAPVFIVTNALVVRSNEFRFYLDLNRNGFYDPNGLQPVINPLGGYYDLNGNLVPYSWPPPPNIQRNFFVGDPEWIGVLRRPEFAHSADNPFIYRYAYLVVPAGQTLDLNCIHNQARNTTTTFDSLEFLRDQGVGTFEINLAAFLYDLNTNSYAWGGQYLYDPIGGFPAAGNAFLDAGSLLAYRYGMNPQNKLFTLANVSQLYPFVGPNAFTRDFIDGYSAGPVMSGTSWPPSLPATDRDSGRVARPWAGAESPNHFYSTQDLFDKNKTALGIAPGIFTFTDRLINTATNKSSYDRTTFYRLLSQLGTDSAPEPSGKMNVNYCNVDALGYVVPNKATNFLAWPPTQFFTNAAIRLLTDAGYTVGAPYSTSNILVTNFVGGIVVTNLQIQIWPTNYYTPSVHRLLQLTANIYDATTNRLDTGYPYLPTVMQPLFQSYALGSGKAPGIYIIGYQEVTNATQYFTNSGTPLDLSDLPNIAALSKTASFSAVYGIPLVIGAKKGLPNFNEFAMHSQLQVTRKLQFHRPGTSTIDPVNEIDQMFVVGISNVFGVEGWNSYATQFPRSLQLIVWPDISVTVSNVGVTPATPLRISRFQLTVATNIPAIMWAGYNQTLPQSSFQVPVMTNLVFLSNMTYLAAGGGSFIPKTGQFERQQGTTNFYVPNWKFTMRTRLRFAVVDTSITPNRIVDYVNLASDTITNVMDAMSSGGACGDSYTPNGSNGSMWCTNRMHGINLNSVPTYGINNQIEASMGHIKVDWNSSTHEFPSGMSVDDAITFFRGQFIPGFAQSSNTFATPYQPFRNVYLVTSWQANDPLVHYTAGDLVNPWTPAFMADSLAPLPTASLGQLNKRYEPWGGSPVSDSGSLTKYDMTLKDALVSQSDNWDFPTNKFPNVGWLGRVHRGTPWQTVFFKSFGFTNYATWFNNWRAWSGNGQLVTNWGQFSTNVLPLYVFGTPAGVGWYDSLITQPTNDWHLLDLFTTALNDNATRGQLSINQTNLAAWSAVLSGVLVFTNTVDTAGKPVLNPLTILPAGYYDPYAPSNWPPLVRLYNGINFARSNNSPRHAFSRLSDILAVPELTMASPFLNTVGLPSPLQPLNGGLNDEAYERLPQQIAGLLKADSVPRFVIYAFGQTLKPESTRAIVKSGPFVGLCTNYQVVAESATRTVVRFEGVPPNHGTNAITTLHPVIESFNLLPPD
jgi:hypothetical protein